MQRILKSQFLRFNFCTNQIFTIAIIGKPNVGKSTLFNKLYGSYNAITDNQPGMTRDRKEIISKILDLQGEIMGYPIKIVDTAGWEQEYVNQNKDMLKKMIQQTELAIKQANLNLFVVDLKHGINSVDFHLSSWIKKTLKQKDDQGKLILVGNKSENQNLDYQLGLGEPIQISAETGDGLVDLLQVIDKNIPDEYKTQDKNKRLTRIQKYNKIKQIIKNEIIELQKKEDIDESFSIKQWEYDFDKNNLNPEDNSDLDYDFDEQLVDKHRFDANNENYQYKKPIQVSLVGRPNVGKSTLLNSLLKENRVVVDDFPGTTRDSIQVSYNYKVLLYLNQNRKLLMIDTAGLVKKQQIKSQVEKKTYNQSLQSIQYSAVCVLLIDSLSSFRIQDLRLAKEIVDEGRSLIFVVNKWDLMQKEWQQKAIKYMRNQLDKSLGELKNVPMITISALNGYQVEKLMDEVLNIYDKWNLRINTGMMNDWLKKFKKLHNLPQHNGNQLNIQFISQVKSRPPTFTIFVNDATLFDDEYQKFMKNKLSTEFNFQGIPIRFQIRDKKFVIQKQKTVDKYQAFKDIKRKMKIKLKKVKISQQIIDKMK